MALIGDMQYLTIGGNTYSIPIGGSTVQVEQNLTSGTKTATITVDGTPYELFAPSTVTETDPVFTASAAAGITSTDISNWNAKVSDDKTWNGVTLDKSSNVTYGGYVPRMSDTTDTTAKLIAFSTSPTSGRLSQYDNNAYLNSTTPSANDNSTKVATTAYVNAVIPDTSSFVSKSGDTMTGNLAFADGKGITLNYDGQTDTLRLIGYGSNFRVANFSTQTILRNIYTPDSDNAAANKKYVDDKFASITIPTSTGSATTGISISDHSSTTIYGVQSTTTSVTGVSGSTTASKVTVGTSSTDYGITAAGSGSATLTFTMDTTDTKKLKITFSHTHTAPTLGSKVPTVSASNVTVPIAAASATTVPIKNTSSTTVITSGTHSVTDMGHTHTI